MVVIRNKKDELENAVSEMMEIGWVPSGGVDVSQIAGPGGKMHTIFSQGMIRVRSEKQAKANAIIEKFALRDDVDTITKD
jgi:hypothetical protein